MPEAHRGVSEFPGMLCRPVARKDLMMEWWKLFSGTFVLIFLAELGDKTQLAAMAKTADSGDNSMAKWVVFLGASLALVSSTFIAVFAGHLIKAVVPDERYIKIAAGGLFLVFGFMILYETYASYRGEGAPAVAAAPAAPRSEADIASAGFVGNIALRAAMDFESSAAGRYRRLAGNASPALSALLLELAGEEEGHLASLRGLPEQVRAQASTDRDKRPAGISGRRLAAATAADCDTLDELIRHEEATAAFYRQLAEHTLIPSVRGVFARLAEEEANHARRLAEAAVDCPT